MSAGAHPRRSPMTLSSMNVVRLAGISIAVAILAVAVVVFHGLESRNANATEVTRSAFECPQCASLSERIAQLELEVSRLKSVQAQALSTTAPQGMQRFEQSIAQTDSPDPRAQR